MPTKTDRILSYLPGTFRALPRPNALYSVADGFGNELLQAENTLVSVMRSHWVDTADQAEEVIDDLRLIASLYGLAPRDDEEVEEFRGHLKHYVRTFLEGTPTVQGILRVVAEALGLQIADSYDQMDTWWTRSGSGLVTVTPQGDDARDLLFGAERAARGQDVQRARITGITDLSDGVDLQGGSKLVLKIDGGAAVTIDLAALVSPPAKLSDIVNAINSKVANVASASDGRYLALASPTAVSSATIEVLDVDGDAAPHLLGLAPRAYRGSSADAARVTSSIDLQSGVDLTDRRYLRLMIDGKYLAEVDCADGTAALTGLDHIRDSINAALKQSVASHDGHFLSLTSPSSGFSSTIQFQSPAGQDATEILFGPVGGIFTGRDPQPAAVTGTRDLSHGVDLGQNANIVISLDGGPALVIRCAGATPAATMPAEIVSAINLAAGQLLASQNGKFITLSSPTKGPSSSLQFVVPSSGDATFAIFGIAPREASGQPARGAQITGLTFADGKVNLAAQHLVKIAIDGGSAITVDFWEISADRLSIALADIAKKINAAAGIPVASIDAQRLVLASPTLGSSGSVAVLPLERTVERRFVSRAFILDEASQRTLGIFKGRAIGTAATPARVEGTAELSRGIDLRDDGFLNISIDGAPAQIVQFASPEVPRPRIALPDEIVKAINVKTNSPGKDAGIASTDGHHLFLTSPTSGSSSSIEFQPVGDAAGALGLQAGSFYGRDATGVVFTGTVDLSSGVDLSVAGKIKLSVDGATAVEIDCAGADPAHTSLGEIVTRINIALKAVVASPSNQFITLSSPDKGAGSKLELLAPSSGDATRAIFGIGPRSYHGENAVFPQIVGSKGLGGGADLSASRFLRLAIDGGKPQTIDCAAAAANPKAAQLPEIITAINQAAGLSIASSPDGQHLVLKGPTAGISNRLFLGVYQSDGAFSRVLGTANKTSHGTDAAPATIVGTVDLLAGVDLDERRILRLARDGMPPVDIDISGAKPSKTFLDEIVARINAVLPGVASATGDDRLQLTSTSTGESSTLEVLPLRMLELMEFTAVQASETQVLKHGGRFSINNAGAADSLLALELAAPQGVAGAEFINRTTGMRVRVLQAVPARATLRLSGNDRGGLRAEIVTAENKTVQVPGSMILAGTQARQVWVPYTGPRRLGGGGSGTYAALQLNNPDAWSIAILRARRRGLQAHGIQVAVVPAVLPAPLAAQADGSRTSLVGQLVFNSGVCQLLDANQKVIANLRAGAAVSPSQSVNKVVLVQGKLYPGESAPVMMVEFLALLFDVTVRGGAPDGSELIEQYAGVGIGMGEANERSLTLQILARPSQLVVAKELPKAAALFLPRGRTEWSYLTCDASRFNHSNFNHAAFAGGACTEQGVFNASVFTRHAEASKHPPHWPESAVFANGPAVTTEQLTLQWTSYEPGTFVVNLPADLPEKFGARFGQARFGRVGDSPELFANVVTEPESDPDFLVPRIQGTSHLVQAARVPRPPLGWDPMPMPFHHPRGRKLTGATDTKPAAIYLSEPGVPGFFELKAIQPGTWGNTIEVTARKASPGRFDLTIGYAGARFECARQIALSGKVLGPGEDSMPSLTGEIIKPRPVGVLQGKAAGVKAAVTRDGVEPEQQS